jgi:hypothetical protein
MRREGSARWQRYHDLTKSRTVGAFLRKHPGWHGTIARYIADGKIEIRRYTHDGQMSISVLPPRPLPAAF